MRRRAAEPLPPFEVDAVAVRQPENASLALWLRAGNPFAKRAASYRLQRLPATCV